jgi:hypothetical protein
MTVVAGAGRHVDHFPVGRRWSLGGTDVGTIVSETGSRMDDCQLVSLGRNGVQNIWLFADGTDCFVPHAAVVDLWQVQTGSRAA